MISTLDVLVDELLHCKPDFENFPLRKSTHRKFMDKTAIRGVLAEDYVYSWLASCPGVAFRRRNISLGRYTLTKTARTFLVRMDQRRVLEYDDLILYHGLPVAVEVKAGRTHGFSNRIPFVLEVTRALYRTNDVGLLLFTSVPEHTGREFPYVLEPSARWMSLGYSKRQLDLAVKKYVSYRDLTRAA